MKFGKVLHNFPLSVFFTFPSISLNFPQFPSISLLFPVYSHSKPGINLALLIVQAPPPSPVLSRPLLQTRTDYPPSMPILQPPPSYSLPLPLSH